MICYCTLLHRILWCGPGKDQGGYEWHRSKENAICLASLVTVNPIPITISHLVFSISLGEFKNTQWNQCDYVSCQGKYQNTPISFLSHIFNLTADEWEAGKETVVGGGWWCPKSFDPRSQIPVWSFRHKCYFQEGGLPHKFLYLIKVELKQEKMKCAW